MKKIALITTYFSGDRQGDFTPWLIGCKGNPTVDFYMFTDNERPQNLPENVIWTILSFDEFKKTANQKLGFKANLKTAYKLCDYKPAYADMFDQYAHFDDYDFWGFCDTDLVFGDIRAFVTDEILDSYDKIQELGHFVLVRNINDSKKAYKLNCAGKTPYKTVYKAKYNMSFDEGGGGSYSFPDILKERGYRRFWKRDFCDVKTECFEFRHKAYDGDRVYYKKIDYISYKNGKIFVKNENEEKLVEYMYAHFQGRNMQNLLSGNESEFYMVSNAYVKNLDEKYFSNEFLQKQREIHANKQLSAKKSRRKKKLYLLCYLLRKGLIFNAGWRRYVIGGWKIK